MKRKLVIIAGLILALSGMPAMACRDCVPSGVESEAISTASCCTAQCAMRQSDPCGGVDLQTTDSDAPVVPATPHPGSTQEKPLTVASSVDGNTDVAAAATIITIELDESHDPPGPPLTILHAQFLI